MLAVGARALAAGAALGRRATLGRCATRSVGVLAARAARATQCCSFTGISLVFTTFLIVWEGDPPARCSRAVAIGQSRALSGVSEDFRFLGFALRLKLSIPFASLGQVDIKTTQD